MVDDSLSGQMEAIRSAIAAKVAGLASVIGLEEMDDALKITARLPCAVVVYSGDYPTELADGRQQVKRYWSVVLVLELQRKPAYALDLVQAVIRAGIGLWPCPGVGILTLAGARFVTKFDKTRVAYEIRFVHDTWIIYDQHQ